MSSDNKEIVPKEAQFDVSEVIQGTDLLRSEDLAFLQQHAGQFEHRFRTRSIFRSKFEMEASVLNEDVHPTADSKYWQAIGEQNVHLTELISLSFQTKKMQKDIDLKEIDLEDALLDLRNLEKTITPDSSEKALLDVSRRKKEIEKIELELEEQRFNIKQSHKVAQERIREVKEWEDIIASLEPLLEFGTEDFELHHPKRYMERYGRRALRLDVLTPEDKENVISHVLSFAQHPSNRESATQLLRHMVVDNQMPMNHGLVRALQERIGQPDVQLLKGSSSIPVDQDYPSKEIANHDDPVVKRFFTRKTLKILVVSPHRLPTDKMVMNLWALQTPAAFDCQIWEPHGMSVADARTTAIKKARAEGYSFVQWIDDDLIFPRNALVQLINHGADIVGGFYYRKYEPLESCGMHEYMIKGEMVPRPITNFRIGDIIHNTLVLPSGATLLNLDIFNNSQMTEPWYRTVTVTGAPAITEDTYFCEKAAAAGYDVITDLGVQCVHVDMQRMKLFGHPDVVDMSKNTFYNPQDYCL